MSPHPTPTRRRVLCTVGLGAIGALAGCSQSTQSTQSTQSPSSSTTDAATTTSTEATTTAVGGESDEATSKATESGADTTDRLTASPSTTANEKLDLREANVVGVEFTRQNGSVRFDVTLIHDDSGEDGYANWWQVETVDGEQLGRRELLHAHGTQEFTRSETVEISDETTCVVVRGHDQTHGYGGQAMLVNLETGATRAVRQGSEKQSFTGSTCP